MRKSSLWEHGLFPFAKDGERNNMVYHNGMTREQYESYKAINVASEKFHNITGKYPTKTEAIKKIREYRCKHLFPAGNSWGKRAIIKRSYYRFAMTELITRLSESEESDPIKVIYEFLYYMDDMVCAGENSRIWIFAGDMRDAAQDALELFE